MRTAHDNPTYEEMIHHMERAHAMRRAAMADGLRRLLTGARPLADRYAAWRERRQRRARFVRELMAYSDDDLAELHIPRVDIPRLAHQAA